MKPRVVVLLFISALSFENVSSQTTYYSVNAATNPNSLSSWTRDPSGSTILFPPMDFTDTDDIFIIDGESMTLTDDWIVAGEVRVFGTVQNPNRLRFQAKVFAVYANLSSMFIGQPGDARVGTLIIGPNGQLNTGNSFPGEGMQIDTACIVMGTLLNTSPIIGAGSFVLRDSATLHFINGGINSSDNIGLIHLTGPCSFSKNASYVFEFNAGTFETGDALPDTVANLTINTGDNTTASLRSSTTVVGDFCSSGSFGGSNNNSFILLDSNKLECRGNIEVSGGLKIQGNDQSTFVVAGNSVNISLPEMIIGNLTIDRSAVISLNGNVSVSKNLTLLDGIVKTGDHVMQLGISSEGSLGYTKGRVVGTYAAVKDNVNASELRFPLGTDTYDRSIVLTFTTPPTSGGLIKASHTDVNGTSPLSPSVDDAGYDINYRLNLFWDVTPVLITGGVFNVEVNIQGIESVSDPSGSRLLVSNDGVQFYASGTHVGGAGTVVKRSGMAGENAYGKYFVGGDSSRAQTSVKNQPTQATLFFLEQNYPNPFNSFTNISFSLSDRSHVTLKIFSLLGEELSTLITSDMPKGKYSYRFDGSNLATGIYFYRLETDQGVQSRRLLLLR